MLDPLLFDIGHAPVVLDAADVQRLLFFDPAMAFKMTVRRRWGQGTSGERDTFGAQQRAPLLDIMIPSRLNA